jgi:hypothetical protein
MGAVYLAEQIAVGNRPVALKVGSAQVRVFCVPVRLFISVSH